MRTRHQTRRELDKIDRHILRILQAEGRLPFTELGERVGLSTTPCTERVRRLEREVAAQRGRAKQGQSVRPNIQPEGASAHAANRPTR